MNTAGVQTIGLYHRFPVTPVVRDGGARGSRALQIVIAVLCLVGLSAATHAPLASGVPEGAVDHGPPGTPSPLARHVDTHAAAGPNLRDREQESLRVANSPRQELVQSSSWAGFAYCPEAGSSLCQVPQNGSRIWGVEGTFSVPAVVATGTEAQSIAEWVGIGGFESPGGLPDLVQAGVIVQPANVSGRPPSTEVWWTDSTTPVPVELSPTPTAAVGDALFVRILFNGLNSVGQQTWLIEIRDNSTASVWSGNELCTATCIPTRFGSADWVVESPTAGSADVPPPAFETVECQGGMWMNDSGVWSYLSQSNSTSRIAMAGYNETLSAVPSALYAPGEFWIQYLVDTEDGLRAGSWGDLTRGTVEPGGALYGNLTIDSPANQSPSDFWDLGLAIELETGDSPPIVLPNGEAALLQVLPGNSSYSVSGILPSTLPYGSYLATISLWYLSPGTVPTDTGTLALFSTTPSEWPVISVTGPAVQLSVAPSGTLDLGQVAVLDAVTSGGEPPYAYSWSGLPDECTSSDSANVSCAPSVSGSYDIHVTVADRFGASTDGTTVLTAVAYPTVGVLRPAGAVLEGESFLLVADLTGGVGPFQISWDGLPPGCQATAPDAVECVSSESGLFDIEVTVSDAVGGRAVANTTLFVQPALLGLSLPAVLLIGGLAAVAVVQPLLAWRRRRSGRRSDEPFAPPPPRPGRQT